MPDLIKMLQAQMENDPSNGKLLGDALQEIEALRKERDQLAEILIILARTEFPWDADGKVTGAFSLFKERYLKAMHEACEVLGLDLRSTITRSEPRT
jgi:hypothetical protein